MSKLYPALATAKSPIKLQGPSGGDDIAKSQFMLIPERGLWQWEAWDVYGNLYMVAEVPFVLADVCDTVYGALWAIRDVAGQYIKPTRAGRNQ